MSSVLDPFLPEFAHRSRHGIKIDAVPDAVWAALHAVTGRELPLTRALMFLRALPAARVLGGPGGSFRAIAERPFLDAFPAATGLTTLRDDPPLALVAGAAMRPWRRSGTHVEGLDPAGFAAFSDPGYVRVAISFEIEPVADTTTRLATETRVQPTSPDAARRFAAYWLGIRMGSALIRRDILAAVARRVAPRRPGGRRRSS